MIARVLVDTGPLVAICAASDEHHKVCLAELREIAPPLLTCWPVITEAAWLLRRWPRAIQRLLDSFEQGLLRLLPADEVALPAVSRFLHLYRSLQPQLADALLMHLAERERIDTVFTLDRRDFSIFRLSKGRALRVIPQG